jgi:hypothetical protein
VQFYGTDNHAGRTDRDGGGGHRVHHDGDTGDHNHHERAGDRGGDGKGDGAQPTVTLLTGISVSDPVPGFELPPDNGLAVDSGYIVSDVNSVVKWSDLTGANPVEVSMASFFAPLGNYNFFVDARVIYNDAVGQFVVSSSAPDASSNYHFLIAISNDANPNNGFGFADFQFADRAALIDQPDVAVDGSTLFLLGSLAEGQQHVLVDNRDDQGAPTKEVDVTGGGIYKEIAGQQKGDYLVSHDLGTITLKHLDTAGIIDGTSTVDLGDVSSNYREQYLATQGTTTPLDAGDERVYGLALDNGTLWTTFEVTPTTGPDAGTPNVHWAELNVSDPSHIAVIDQGTISGSKIGPGVGTETGSVAVDGCGDTIMNFVASGDGMTPTDYFEIKAAGATDFSDATAYALSAGPFVDPTASIFGDRIASRFGDYSSAVSDPNDPHGFYISNEVGITPGSWQWATSLAHVIVPSNGTVV